MIYTQRLFAPFRLLLLSIACFVVRVRAREKVAGAEGSFLADFGIAGARAYYCAGRRHR